MRVLFDQATPVPIRQFLVGHTVRTAAQEHWDTLQNGELLAVAERSGFEVFLTTDKNMRYQQNLTGRSIAVVVIGVQQWPAGHTWPSS
jgi:predicted nuclease of predicted toxin-antitoxin system